jgi:hypothetical protein
MFKNNPATISLLLMVGLAIACLLSACDDEHPVDSRPHLPKRPDKWVNSVRLDPDSKASYVEADQQYVVISVSNVRDIDGLTEIRVGDEIEGLRIGAIRCSFHWTDASYNGRQYMWRGRWQCMAGRSKEEVEGAVGENGEKFFDYIVISPVSLD